MSAKYSLMAMTGQRGESGKLGILSIDGTLNCDWFFSKNPSFSWKITASFLKTTLLLSIAANSSDLLEAVHAVGIRLS